MAGKKSEKKVKSEEKKEKGLTKEQAEKLIVELSGKNMPLSKIGHALKKEHGVKRVKELTGKMSKVLSKEKIKTFPEDLQSLLEKAAKLREHSKKNKKDMVAKRGLQMTEAHIRKSAQYLKKRGSLEQDWSYVPAK